MIDEPLLAAGQDWIGGSEMLGWLADGIALVSNLWWPVLITV